MARADQKAVTGKQQIGVALRGGIAAWSVGLLIMLLCSFLISKGWLSLDGANRFAVASCAAGGILGALPFLKGAGGRSLAVGFLTGTVQFILYFLLGLIVAEHMEPGAEQLALLSACLCSCGFAGSIVRKGKKKRRP